MTNVFIFEVIRHSLGSTEIPGCQVALYCVPSASPWFAKAWFTVMALGRRANLHVFTVKLLVSQSAIFVQQPRGSACS